MVKSSLIIINPNSGLAHKALDYFAQEKIKYIIIKHKKDLTRILRKKQYPSYILCGGDGFINNFINTFSLTNGYKSLPTISIIPCGKANDLALALNLPLKIEYAYNKILKNRTKKIDLIRVNNKFYVTGGGLGLPVEVVIDVNSFLAKNKWKVFANYLRDLIYLVFVIKKVIFGYNGIKNVIINGKSYDPQRFMLIAIQNQPFIGKRFYLTPNANNQDNYFEVCIINRPKGILSNLIMIYRIIKGNHIISSNVSQLKSRKIKIELEKEYYFMGDGEILCKSKKLDIEIIPNALTVHY